MPVVPCPSPCPPITRGIVQFDAPEFVALYPEFAGLTNGQMQNGFNDAQVQFDNSCASAVQNANKRLIILYALTAHNIFLQYGSNDGNGQVTPPPGIVGRIDSASEGSVSVHSAYPTPTSLTQAFLTQTRYGAKFLADTAVYRMAKYTGPPQAGPNGPGYPWDSFGVLGEF